MNGWNAYLIYAYLPTLYDLGNHDVVLWYWTNTRGKFLQVGVGESPLSNNNFFLTINCPFYKDKLQRSIWRYLLYNQLHLPCCVSVAVGDPCQTVNGPFGRILAKLILASGLLLVMDLCTFNLIFDSMTNPQGTKEEEEKEKSCPNLVLASCITWPLPTEDCLCAWTVGPGLDQSLSHPSPNIAYCLPFADSLTNATECILVDDCAGEMLIASNDNADDSKYEFLTAVAEIFLKLGIC